MTMSTPIGCTRPVSLRQFQAGTPTPPRQADIHICPAMLAVSKEEIIAVRITNGKGPDKPIAEKEFSGNTSFVQVRDFIRGVTHGSMECMVMFQVSQKEALNA